MSKSIAGEKIPDGIEAEITEDQCKRLIVVCNVHLYILLVYAMHAPLFLCT